MSSRRLHFTMHGTKHLSIICSIFILLPDGSPLEPVSIITAAREEFQVTTLPFPTFFQLCSYRQSLFTSIKEGDFVFKAGLAVALAIDAWTIMTVRVVMATRIRNVAFI